MPLDAWLTLGILIVIFALLILSTIPASAVFLGGLTVAVALGLAPLSDSLKGFSNEGVLTVGALFMVAAGMYSTGAISLIADRLIGRPTSMLVAQFKILPATCFTSAFLNNTPIVAMLIPVIQDLARTTRLTASKLLIPMNFSSILGGAATLIGTSSNLIIAGLLVQQIAVNGDDGPYMREVTLLDPAKVGAPAAIIGIVFIIFLGVRLLPSREEDENSMVQRRLYNAEFVVDGSANLVGKTTGSQGLASGPGYTLNSVTRTDLTIEPGGPDIKLQAGDQLNFYATIDALPGIWTTIGLIPAIDPLQIYQHRHSHKLVEVVVSPQAKVVGRQIIDLPERDDPYETMLVALSRDGRAPEGSLSDQVVEAGDNAILEVTDTFFMDNRREQDFLLTRSLSGYTIQRTSRAVIATGITIAMVALAILGVFPMLVAAMLAAGAMLITGCLTLHRAGRSIEIQTLLVMAAAIGLEASVTASGLASQIADILISIGGDEPWIALIVVYCGAVIMTNVITNSAAAAFMFPVALSMAAALDVSFMPFVIVLMMGTSYAFITPQGYQTNLMVQGPGGYQFMDFVKVGVPLTVVAGVVVILLAPIFFPFSVS